MNSICVRCLKNLRRRWGCVGVGGSFVFGVLVVVVWVRGKAMLVSIALRVLLGLALVPGSFVLWGVWLCCC